MRTSDGLKILRSAQDDKMHMTQHTTKSEAETRELAAEFAETLKGGDVIELVGDLGAGKTTFVRGVLESFGSTARVKSPTFTVMNEYPTSTPGIEKIIHLDLYRFKTPDELEALELGDYIRPENIVFVEWPNIFNVPIFEHAKRVEFEFIDDNTRKITL